MCLQSRLNLHGASHEKNTDNYLSFVLVSASSERETVFKNSLLHVVSPHHHQRPVRPLRDLPAPPRGARQVQGRRPVEGGLLPQARPHPRAHVEAPGVERVDLALQSAEGRTLHAVSNSSSSSKYPLSLSMGVGASVMALISPPHRL